MEINIWEKTWLEESNQEIKKTMNRIHKMEINQHDIEFQLWKKEQ